MTKTDILRNAAPKLAVFANDKLIYADKAPARTAAEVGAPVVTPPPPAPPTDDQIINNTAEKQYAAIVENLRRAKIAQASQAIVEAKLKADGISLDDINADHLAQQRLAELEQAAQLKAADVAARALFKAKYGVDSE